MGLFDPEFLNAAGGAVAIVEESGLEISYAELADRCADFARAFAPQRELILLQAGNDLASVVAYLAALSAGHVPILVGAGDTALAAEIIETFSPTLIFRPGETLRREARPADLHPELALLLPTSGSTGRPRLVRLSRSNLEANAESIIHSLGIGAGDRAITSLPVHYSYGLSVLNSHIRAGASLVLTDRSVVDPAFWDLFRAARATSIAGVPYSYELFERVGLRQDPPPSLRTMTQAGGRLSADLVKAYAEFGAKTGVRFFVMYGQTEAAPRMACLPPELAALYPDGIGRAVAGGSLQLVDSRGRAIERDGEQGELVYRGPNVMMGYGEAPEDLSLAPGVRRLKTGDLAVRTNGDLYRIVGRASRFVKIAGLRIGLDDLEAALAETGRKAFVAGSDEALSVCLVGDEDPAAARDLVRDRCGLPLARVRVFATSNPPLLSNGKADYGAIKGRGEAGARRGRDGQGTVAAVYAHALGIDVPPAAASFASLGGDSLSYVNASLGVERLLGQLPAEWEHMPVGSLQAMTSAPAAPSNYGWISSEIVVRVAALSIVIAGHAVESYDWLRGGTNVLFALAGYSLARFQGDNLRKGRVRPALSAAFYRIVLPYELCILTVWLLRPDWLSLVRVLLLDVFTSPRGGVLGAYWFIETLIHALLITCALFLLPPVRRLSVRHPFGAPLALAAGAALLMGVLPPLWNDGQTPHYTIDAWLFAYFLGWAGYAAGKPWQKAVVVLLAMAFTAWSFGGATSRSLWMGLGLAGVLFVSRLKAPAVLNALILRIAAAGYFIYLLHPFVWHVLETSGAFIRQPLARIAVTWLGSVLLGLLFANAWSALITAARRVLGMVNRTARSFRPKPV